MRKKGQTATEYLIILAVVIIIGLIVVGVLSGIPSIGGGAKSNSANSYWNTAKIAITSKSVTPDGNVTLNLRNNFADTITITNIALTDSANQGNQSTFNTIIPAGATSEFVVNNVTSGDPNSAYSYSIEIDYTAADSATYIFNGDGNEVSGIRTN